jgi:hypothetical protein
MPFVMSMHRIGIEYNCLGTFGGLLLIPLVPLGNNVLPWAECKWHICMGTFAGRPNALLSRFFGSWDEAFRDV